MKLERKRKFVLLWNCKDCDHHDFFDDDVWELFELCVSFMDDYDQFRDVCWEIIHNFEDYMEEFVLWNIASAVHRIRKPFSLHILSDELTDLFYSTLNQKEIELKEIELYEYE